jgi:hypothetical protein
VTETQPQTKTCTGCGVPQPLDAFGRIRTKGTLRARCKECCKTYQRDYYRTTAGQAKAERQNQRRRSAGPRSATPREPVVTEVRFRPPHCQHCTDLRWEMRDRPHCVNCGWGDRPLDERDWCSACIAWTKREQPVLDYENAVSLLAAIVERAKQDAQPTLRQLEAPAPCDECEEWLLICGSQYIDVITEYGHRHEGDSVAIFGLVATIALDRERLAA